jgi:hypothetical protein
VLRDLFSDGSFMRVTSGNFAHLGDPSLRLLHGSAFRALGALARRDSVGGLRLFSTCRLAQCLRLSRNRSFPCPWRFGAEGLSDAFGTSARKVFSIPLALWRGGTF